MCQTCLSCFFLQLFFKLIKHCIAWNFKRLLGLLSCWIVEIDVAKNSTHIVSLLSSFELFSWKDLFFIWTKERETCIGKGGKDWKKREISVSKFIRTFSSELPQKHESKICITTLKVNKSRFKSQHKIQTEGKQIKEIPQSSFWGSSRQKYQSLGKKYQRKCLKHRNFHPFNRKHFHFCKYVSPINFSLLPHDHCLRFMKVMNYDSRW